MRDDEQTIDYLTGALTGGARPAAVGLKFTEDGAPYVFRRKGAGFEKAKVTVGRRGPARTVVTEGLAAGDEIALSKPEEMN